MAPDIGKYKDTEWRLDDFVNHEAWKNILGSMDIQALDFLPLGGEHEVEYLNKKIIIKRII